MSTENSTNTPEESALSTPESTLVAGAAQTVVTPLYDFRAASKQFGGGANVVNALSDINLRVNTGEYIVIEGPSGSGKTTLLQLLGALDKPTSGEVLFEGRDLQSLGEDEQARFRRDAVGFVFQQFNLIPTLTAKQNVEIAMVPQGISASARSAKARELLEKVGLGGRLDHLPVQLSGGEQQRVAIARALANNARVLLADEPTGNLDSATGDEVLNLLHQLWAEEGLTILLITHDASISERASRLVHMRDGKIVADDTTRG